MILNSLILGVSGVIVVTTWLYDWNIKLKKQQEVFEQKYHNGTKLSEKVRNF